MHFGDRMSLSELTDPRAVQAALDEFDALGRSAFLAKYGFGRSREYMVRLPDGRLYDSKAIVGAAHGFQFPDRGPLNWESFTGGENTVERKLRDLGFEVVRIGEDWSREEVDLVVADYFEMLRLESAQQAFNKKAHNRALRQYLRSRSSASIELKHQNISAALDELDLPFIQGYKPRSNMQSMLREAVQAYIRDNSDSLARSLDELQASMPTGRQPYVAALVAAPPGRPASINKRPRLPRKLDFAARDEANRKLGREGEQWTVGFEQHRLTDLGRSDLGLRVDWVADRLGDGAGHDISSFDDTDEQVRYIEVKTTNAGPETAFVVSQNEVSFSNDVGEAFCLYRVFQFRAQPKLYILRGSLEQAFALTPMEYRARLKEIV
jgi:hypothetical protein